MNNKEIEVKFIINEAIKENILRDLGKDITLTKTHQIDTYYIPDFRDFEINGETMECVRIRETEKDITLGYKKIHRETTPVYCDEYEIKIDNKEQMENFLFAINFSVQMIIDKTRLSCKINDYEFDFDSVKGVGEFLEIELKNNNADINAIFDLVAKYGLTRADVTYDGIQVLVKKAMAKQ